MWKCTSTHEYMKIKHFRGGRVDIYLPLKIRSIELFIEFSEASRTFFERNGGISDIGLLYCQRNNAKGNVKLYAASRH